MSQNAQKPSIYAASGCYKSVSKMSQCDKYLSQCDTFETDLHGL